MKSKVLITGGAGYIGSYTTRLLVDQGFDVTVIDNLENGNKQIEKIAKLYVVDIIKDLEKIKNIFEREKPQIVIHLAAHANVEESIINPKKYFLNNTQGTENILKIMVKTKVNKIIFSSSCSVYGNSKQDKISETSKLMPESPYGKSKEQAEKIIYKYTKKYNISAVVLRYFNVIGQTKIPNVDKFNKKSDRILTKICESYYRKNNIFYIYGSDYKTKDGTCIRDYVHVLDVARANLKSLYFLQQNYGYKVFNIGTGKGLSVLDLVEAFEKTIKTKLNVKLSEKRKGDVTKAISNIYKAKKYLKWKPINSNIESIISTTWNYYRKGDNN